MFAPIIAQILPSEAMAGTGSTAGLCSLLTQLGGGIEGCSFAADATEFGTTDGGGNTESEDESELHVSVWV